MHPFENRIRNRLATDGAVDQTVVSDDALLTAEGDEVDVLFFAGFESDRSSGGHVEVDSERRLAVERQRPVDPEEVEVATRPEPAYRRCFGPKSSRTPASN